MPRWGYFSLRAPRRPIADDSTVRQQIRSVALSCGCRRCALVVVLGWGADEESAPRVRYRVSTFSCAVSADSTVTFRGLDRSAIGMTTSSTPLSYAARMLSVSTSSPMVNCRW